MPRRTRVLLVEDDELSALYATTVLELAGCAVRHVRDGVEATDAAIQDRYDLVLMDYHLPSREGAEVTRLIRVAESLSGRAPTRIIGVTASAMPHEIQACRNAGMDDVMTKPFSVEQLNAVLGRWVPGHSPGG